MNSQTINMLCEYFEKQLSPLQARAYLLALADIPDDVLDAAAIKICADSKWFPKISEIRDAAQRVTIRGARVWKDWRETEVPGIIIIGPEMASFEHGLGTEMAVSQMCPCRICRGEITEAQAMGVA